MTTFGTLAALFIALAGFASGGTVTSSASAPAADLLDSSPTGATDTGLFDEDANNNHARGQLFSLPDGSGTAYEITAITVKKSTDQTYVNDTLTLRVFEGTEAQWITGTGHSSGTDGSDYLVDTSVNLLHTEAFNLNSTITNDHYVTFQLSAPIVVSEDSDFGFFMTYDQGGGTQDRFRHREAGTGGGRLSITTTSHGATSAASRKVVYYVQGTPVTPTGTVTASASVPTTDILATKALGSTPSNLFTYAADSNHARGQLFSLGNGSGTAFDLTAITIQKDTAQTFVNDTMTLHVFRGTQSQWDTGTGHLDTSPDYYGGTTVTPLHSEAFTLDGAFAADEFVTFELAVPLELDESEDYGFFFTYDQISGADSAFSHLEADNGGRISISNDSHGTSSRSMNHFVIGTPTGTPPAVLSLGSPFQNRMVLQRDKPINIWGEALPSTAVSVSINGTNAAGTSDANGNWKIELPALASGGPHSLVVTSESKMITLSDVLVGDVWFCFGQSNMVRPLSEMDSSASYISDISSNDNIRCLKVDQDGTLGEEESAGMSWLSNSTAGTWTAVGSVFAHQLNASTGVPVGIVWAAWGSSSIEGWMPLELAERHPHFADMLTLYQSISEYRNSEPTSSRLPAPYTTNEEGIAGLSANGWSSNNDDIFMRTRPNIIYNKMVHPMRHYGISGFIWYQGEANSADIVDIARYDFSLPDMVKDYRERFDQGDLPFLGVQLPSINAANQSDWPWFREAQDSLLDLNNAHVAITIDTGSTNSQIHPTDKELIGIRLALLARKHALGESIVADSPRFSSMTIDGNTATISFGNTTGLTTSNRQSPAGFEVAGADMVFHDATSTNINGTQVEVSSSSVTNPVAVRYAWDMLTKGVVNLINTARLPAAPFRTDSWALPGLGAQAPQSIDDAYEVMMDTTLNVAAIGVLDNDIDLNHDALTASLLSDVSDGILNLLPDGAFTYTPHEGFAGTDSFTYECSDGGLTSSAATVTITVTGTQTYYYTYRTGINWNPGDDETSTGDPDFDGIENFLEFALGMNPLLSDPSGLPTLTPSGSDFEYDFNNAQPGVIYEVQLSSDLLTWSDPPYATLTSESTTPVLISTSEAVDGNLFVRLKVHE